MHFILVTTIAKQVPRYTRFLGTKFCVPPTTNHSKVDRSIPVHCISDSASSVIVSVVDVLRLVGHLQFCIQIFWKLRPLDTVSVPVYVSSWYPHTVHAAVKQLTAITQYCYS